jgi:phospholipid/cholesterol/gamma-HCH transport system substrate-binding protein
MNISKAMLVKVLLFAAFCLVLTVALGVKLANSRLFADTYNLSAEFEDATGVLKGDAVKLAGVDIGRVQSATMENGKAVVEFNLDKSVQLPVDSEVAIRWRNVLGQRYLYVYPGTEDKVFEEDALISSDQTRDVNDIGDFINRVGPILKAIDPEQANAFLDAVNTALSGNETQVRKLLDDGAKLAQTLGNEDEEIKGLITSADEVTGAYASQDEALGEIFDNLDDLGVVLRRRTQDINTLLVDFADVQDELRTLLVQNRGNIDSTIGGLERTLGTLSSNKKNLGKTLHSLPLGIMGYHQTSSWGEFFNVRLIKLLVQDSDSNDLVVQEETEGQHGDRGGRPKTGDPCVPCKDGGDGGSGGSGAADSPSPGASSSGHESGAVGVESILRFVLSGGAS